tara:strand:+ start:228 stop:596 length:369 start_codon:yes stop_codon:yes gene_type:complete
MATFPSYTPESRTYTPGQYPAALVNTFSGDEVSVRKTNTSIGSLLRLSFTTATTEQQDEIFLHYGVHNRFQAFDLPSEALLGSNLSFPTGYQWIYSGAPEVSYAPGVITVSVELELVAPYSI